MKIYTKWRNRSNYTNHELMSCRFTLKLSNIPLSPGKQASPTSNIVRAWDKIYYKPNKYAACVNYKYFKLKC